MLLCHHSLHLHGVFVGFAPDGTVDSSKTASPASSSSTFFNELRSGKFVPRAVFADLEPTVVGELLSFPWPYQ